MVALVGLGFLVGSVASSLLVYLVVAPLGWRFTTVIAGAIPLLLVFLLLWKLPESPEFKRDAPGHEAPVQKGSVRLLFAPELRGFTLCMWAMSFCVIMTINLLTNWMPALMHGLGLSPRAAPLANAFFQTGAIAGTLTAGLMIDRFNKFAAGIAIGALGVAGCGLMALTTGNIPVLMLSAAVAGAGVVGLQSLLNILATSVIYPAEARAAGVSWILGIGRIGAIIGPIAGSWLLVAGGESAVIAFTLLPMGIAWIGALALRAIARGRGGVAKPA